MGERTAERAGPRFTVRTPNERFAGVRSGVRFDDGVGRTDDPLAAAQLASLGYRVEEAQRPPAAAPATVADPTPAAGVAPAAEAEGTAEHGRRPRRPHTHPKGG